MGMAEAARILLCAGDPAAAADVRQVLEEGGHVVGWQTLDLSEPENLPVYNLVVIDGSGSPAQALEHCRRLRTRLAERLVPILFVTAEQSPAARLAGLENGADACLLRPFAPRELLAQVQAFLRIKELHDRLGEKTAEIHRINRRLQQAYQQIDHELQLARNLQQSFLPLSLPELPGFRLAVCYRPCGRVGGDFYDVFRLDENHLGLYVADAMGHGVAASLLTIYLKRGVRAKEIFGQQYRLVPPEEILQRLNRDLIDQGLWENPFITMVYALLDKRDGTLRFARAGHPYPLYVPSGRDPELWKVEGSLLGIFDTEFPVQTEHLRPGDKVLFYTDGTDGISFEGKPTGSESFLACAARHRALPIQDFVDRVAHDLLDQSEQLDDFTLLGLETSP